MAEIRLTYQDCKVYNNFQETIDTINEYTDKINALINVVTNSNIENHSPKTIYNYFSEIGDLVNIISVLCESLLEYSAKK